MANCVVTVPEPRYALQVWTTGGEHMEFDFADQPQVTINGNVFTVSSAVTTMEYAATDILRFTLVDKSETVDIIIAVDTPVGNVPEIVHQDGRLSLTGCRPGSRVMVYTFDGRLTDLLTTDSSGSLNLSLAGYQRGGYVIKTENINFKIIRK